MDFTEGRGQGLIVTTDCCWTIWKAVCEWGFYNGIVCVYYCGWSEEYAFVECADCFNLLKGIFVVQLVVRDRGDCAFASWIVFGVEVASVHDVGFYLGLGFEGENVDCDEVLLHLRLA